MTTQYSKASATASASDATLYTVGINVDYAIIIFGVAHNSAANTTLNINVVDSGGSVASTNEYFEKTISTGAPDPLDAITGMVLETGDFISIVANDADRVNVRLGILEVFSSE